MAEPPILIEEKAKSSSSPRGKRRGWDVGKRERNKSVSRDENAFCEPYTVVLSVRSLLLTIVVSALLAFTLGLCGRGYFQHGRSYRSTEENGDKKRVPTPAYTFKQYETRDTIRSSSIMSVDASGEALQKGPEDNLVCRHIIFDVDNADPQFLGSEERLTEAAVALAEHAPFSLAYSGCHQRQESSSSTKRVSCVFAFGSSRLFLDTWPQHGLLLGDLLACSPGANIGTYLPLVPVMEEVFAVPKSISEPAHLVWGQKRRQFRKMGSKFNPEDIDLEETLGHMYIEKFMVHSVQSKFQRIDVVDLLEKKFGRTFEAYTKSLSNDGSFEAQHPEFFQKDRTVWLDNILQSRTFGEAAYHEPLVHPAMFSHKNPKRVAIVGGGEGATLREVLKHKTVEKVVMIEIDEVMVNVSRTYLPEWGDCSNLIGSTHSCFDDPRADIHFKDAIAWFLDNFADKEDFDEDDLFDVIIMDAL
jgi:spermidine synthase